jgi:hypothetical protein
MSYPGLLLLTIGVVCYFLLDRRLGSVLIVLGALVFFLGSGVLR